MGSRRLPATPRRQPRGDLRLRAARPTPRRRARRHARRRLHRLADRPRSRPPQPGDRPDPRHRDRAQHPSPQRPHPRRRRRNHRHRRVARRHRGLSGRFVVTRRNNRRHLAGRDWVRNGDRWTITATHSDGAITVHGAGGGRVKLPAEYVAEHLELAYARRSIERRAPRSTPSTRSCNLRADHQEAAPLQPHIRYGTGRRHQRLDRRLERQPQALHLGQYRRVDLRIHSVVRPAD